MILGLPTEHEHFRLKTRIDKHIEQRTKSWSISLTVAFLCSFVALAIIFLDCFSSERECSSSMEETTVEFVSFKVFTRTAEKGVEHFGLVK